jgi:hypothetical protein
MLTWLLGGYLFLLIFRPYEYWPILGEFRIERIYMIGFIGAVALSSQSASPQPTHGLVLLFVGSSSSRAGRLPLGLGPDPHRGLSEDRVLYFIVA